MSSCMKCLINLCGKDSSVLSYVATKVAFSPPHPTYDIKEQIVSKRGIVNEEIQFIPLNYTLEQLRYPWLEVYCYKTKKENMDHHIIIVQIKNKHQQSKENKQVIIFSHGNAQDIGTVFPFIVDLSTQAKCDVIAYDYSGYGYSDGSPSENIICNDIDHVLCFIKSLGYKENQFVLFGYSIGSVSTVYASTAGKYSPYIKSVVLLSPVTTGIGIVDPNGIYRESEQPLFFSNATKVVQIQCPTLLIHGLLDSVIPPNQSIEMGKKFKLVSQWFPSKGTHDNIITHYRSKFYSKFINFLSSETENTLDYIADAYPSHLFINDNYIDNSNELKKDYYEETNNAITFDGIAAKSIESNDNFSIPHSNNQQNTFTNKHKKIKDHYNQLI